jgi:WD40 repeat protein
MRLAFSPDSKALAAALEVPAIVLWDLAAVSPRATMRWPYGPALYLTFSPDGNALASGGLDASLRIWDGSSGEPRATLRGHADAIDWISFAPGGHVILSASRDATVKLWEVDVASGVPAELQPQSRGPEPGQSQSTSLRIELESSRGRPARFEETEGR